MSKFFYFGLFINYSVIISIIINYLTVILYIYILIIVFMFYKILILKNYTKVVLLALLVTSTAVSLSISSSAQNQKQSENKVKVSIKKVNKSITTLSFNGQILDVQTSLFEEAQKLALLEEKKLSIAEKSALITAVGTSNVPQWLLSVGAAAAAVSRITGVFIGRAVVECTKKLYLCGTSVWGFIQGLNSADDIRRKIFG